MLCMPSGLVIEQYKSILPAPIFNVTPNAINLVLVNLCGDAIGPTKPKAQVLDRSHKCV